MTPKHTDYYKPPPVEHPPRDLGAGLLKRWETRDLDDLTVKDLQTLVTYWTHLIIDARYFRFCTGIDANWGVAAAAANIKTVARLLAKDVLDAAVLEAEQEYQRRCGPRAWKVFREGSLVEVAAYWAELSEWESEVGAVCETKSNPAIEGSDEVAF